LADDSFQLRYEKNESDGTLIFFLRNEVRTSVKAESPTRVAVSMWLEDDIDTLTPPDVGNIKSANFRRRLTREAARKFGEGFDPKSETGKKRLAQLEDDLGRVAAALEKKPEGHSETLRAILEALSGGPSTAELLLKYALVGEYFHDPEGEAYASVPVDGHRETYSLKSNTFKRWLRHCFYSEQKAELPEEEEPTPLRDQIVADVVKQLESKALFEGAEHCVHVRVAEHGGNVYVDLCDERWRSVEITPQGWQVVDQAPVKFVRAKGMAPIPEPVRGGDASALRRLLNLGDDAEGDQAWRLILAWLVKAMRGRGPYPVLILLGGQGTAKSTAARILRSLVDPSTVLLRSPPKNEHDLVIDGVSSWVIAFDNISELPGWLSDALCRLATGGGYATRTLYTDRDQELFEAMRPVVLNGITDVATRPDLLDRALLVNLRPIDKSKRREERKIFAELEETRPGLIGYLFSAVADGLGKMSSVNLNGLPRMADFARWAVATEEALGAERGTFMRAYGASQEEAVVQALEASPVATPLWKLAVLHNGPQNAWTGTATELLKELAERVDDEVRRAAGWPKAANSLSRELKRLAPPLRDVGVFAEQQSRSGAKGSKQWRVFYLSSDDGGNKSSESSEPSEGAKNTSKTQGFDSDDTSDDMGATDDTVRDTIRDKNPANGANTDDTDDTDGISGTHTNENNKCIHGLPGGVGCYICDPDHPKRKG
jgi:hypothetical protein